MSWMESSGGKGCNLRVCAKLVFRVRSHLLVTLHTLQHLLLHLRNLLLTQIYLLENVACSKTQVIVCLRLRMAEQYYCRSYKY